MRISISLKDLTVSPKDFGDDMSALYKLYSEGKISINYMNIHMQPMGCKNIVMLQRRINSGDTFAIEVDNYPIEEETHTVENQYDKEDEEEYED